MSFFAVLEAKGGYFLETLLGGWPTTVKVAAGALVFALIFGLVIALLRLSRWRGLRIPAIAYIEFFRGTPLLVQLFVIYFGLPDAGFEPTHRGQMEAALSLGMTPARAMRYIILPQAMRTMLPPITSFSIVMLKDTAVVSVIAAPEIMFYARNLVTETLQSAVVYSMAGVVYLCMTIPMARLVARLERSRRAWQ